MTQLSKSQTEGALFPFIAAMSQSNCKNISKLSPSMTVYFKYNSTAHGMCFLSLILPEYFPIIRISAAKFDWKITDL